MAYKNNGTDIITNNSDHSFGNVTISPGHFLEITSSDSFVGEAHGYIAGGYRPYSDTNVIEKTPFAADTNSADVGDLSVARRQTSSQSSPLSGYNTGGVSSNVIDKFPFSTDSNATDVGDITAQIRHSSGQSSLINGYSTGGINDSTPSIQNIIHKFPFSTDTNATDVADLSQARDSLGSTGASSSEFGYTMGGRTTPPPIQVDTIDKFPFATDTNATDVGNLSAARNTTGGASSFTNGYTLGGTAVPGRVNTIDKFPFASDSNATDIADVSVIKAQPGAFSSTTFGYSAGGSNPAIPFSGQPGAYGINIIDKFPFASETNATDVGDLTIAHRESGSNQN